MLVAVLIGIMISIVIGISLIPAITGAVDNIKEEAAKAALEAGEPEPTGLVGLLGILPYVFVAVIILGAIAWIGGASDIYPGASPNKHLAKYDKILKNTLKQLLGRLGAKTVETDSLDKIDSFPEPIVNWDNIARIGRSSREKTVSQKLVHGIAILARTAGIDKDKKDVD